MICVWEDGPFAVSLALRSTHSVNLAFGLPSLSLLFFSGSRVAVEEINMQYDLGTSGWLLDIVLHVLYSRSFGEFVFPLLTAALVDVLAYGLTEARS